MLLALGSVSEEYPGNLTSQENLDPKSWRQTPKTSTLDIVE